MADLSLINIPVPNFEIYDDGEYPADMDNTPRPATPSASDAATAGGEIEEGGTTLMPALGTGGC